jgi:hypothetical protein
MKHSIYAFACAVVTACALSAGCYGYESKTTTPSSPTTTATVDSLVGTWKSASTGIIPPASSCTDFTWTPTQQSPTSAAGSFTASCAGGLRFTGTASGTLSAGTITWQAQATGSTPVIASCAITLTGTAELGTNSIRVPYQGNTCLGPVSGVEILDKK